MFDRVASHPASIRADEAERREQIRLFYVGWTRARDCIVLAERPGLLSRKGPMTLLPEGPPANLDTPPAGADVVEAEWAGCTVEVRVRRASAAPAVATEPVLEPTYARGAPRVGVHCC